MENFTRWGLLSCKRQIKKSISDDLVFASSCEQENFPNKY